MNLRIAKGISQVKKTKENKTKQKEKISLKDSSFQSTYKSDRI